MGRMSPTIDQVQARVQTLLPRLQAVQEEVRRFLIGQQALLERLLIGLLTNGHVLIEGVPGLAKTMTVRALARTLHLSFHRLQFTPDLLPADVLGTQIYNPRTGEFTVKRGPIFAQIVLADEINRAPAKVQSALLEAMEERQVTIGETSHALPDPFLVLATQNPIEHEGTYPLPEAQVDRFMLKLKLTYPSKEEERQILDRMAPIDAHIEPQAVLTAEKLLEMRHFLDQIHVDDKIRQYIVEIIHATRQPAEQGVEIASWIQYGASPRASIYLTRAVRALAFLQGRAWVTPQDVKDMVPDVLRHRLILSYEAEAEEITTDDLLRQILDQLPVP